MQLFLNDLQALIEAGWEAPPDLNIGYLLAISGTLTASYTYDADGNRVKAVIDSTTTVYVGAIYEQTTSGSTTTITKYYQAGGQPIALRVNGVVRWLATDHLGSTAVTAVYSFMGL